MTNLQTIVLKRIMQALDKKDYELAKIHIKSVYIEGYENGWLKGKEGRTTTKVTA